MSISFGLLAYDIAHHLGSGILFYLIFVLIMNRVLSFSENNSAKANFRNARIKFIINIPAFTSIMFIGYHYPLLIFSGFLISLVLSSLFYALDRRLINKHYSSKNENQ